MVSPSKKRQIKGRVLTATHKSDRKGGDRLSSKLPYKPLLNKKFYLDVKGYRGTTSITEDIQNLGGIIEEFFSREVNYVISTRANQAGGGSSSEQQPSPNAFHAASPLTPQQPLSSLPSTSHDSPLNLDSPREESGKKRIRTRAEVLLERACVRRQGTSDVLENARLWNVPLWPLAKILKWIALLKDDGRYKPPQKSSAISYKQSSSSPKIQRLKAPFIKSESFSRQYKPVFKELSVWPELNLTNPTGVSPFADPKPGKIPKIQKCSSPPKEENKERQRLKERNVVARVKDGGYCELCTANYTKLKLHLQSDTHLAFVKNDKNYQKLDDLINGYRQGTHVSKMPKRECISEAQNQTAASTEGDPHITRTLSGTTENKVANDKKLQEKDNSYIPMRYSGLMQAERGPASITNKRLRKQIVFEIGETVHSGPTRFVEKDIENEEVGPINSVFLSDAQESASALPDSNYPANIPSTLCSSSQLSPTACHKGSVPCVLTSPFAEGLPPPGLLRSQPKCKVSGKLKVKAPLVTVHVPKAVVPKAIVPIHDGLAVPQTSVSEAAVPGVTVSEAAVPEFTLVEAALPEVPVKTAAVPKVTAANVATKLQSAQTPVFNFVNIKQEALDIVESAFGDQALDVTSPLADPCQDSKEMVRLIQEYDGRIDSFCQKRGSRASKRIGSSEIEELEIKTEPMSRAKRCTRTRKSSCRSDKSESEASDSRSVAEDPLCLDMVDKSAKRGRPKNGEPLVDEAVNNASTKFNGDAIDLVNGTHKVKGRRVSRANSDESDISSCSKSNGNIDHNNEKIDFSLLLEISEADREKFEKKKSKIRRKTADWLLISETEQYYNEKEEIMRNKNKPDSESDSEDSDSDSKSDCSIITENSNLPKGNREKGKRKNSVCIDDDDDDDSKVCAKKAKDLGESDSVRGRPVGGRTRKTLYDLTLLNDDDDDDENFFGFPVSTPIPPSTQSCSVSNNTLYNSRIRGKGGGSRGSAESSLRGKAGKKRLSDAERFLRDNREYYHFQETKERLRRSTSSSSSCDKEKIGNGEDAGCHLEKLMERRCEAGKGKEGAPLARKRPSCDGVLRRVTRRTGGSIDLELEWEEHRKGKERGGEDGKKMAVKEERETAKSNGKGAIRKDCLKPERGIEVKIERTEQLNNKLESTKGERKSDPKSDDKKSDTKSDDKKSDTKSEKKDDGKANTPELVKKEKKHVEESAEAKKEQPRQEKEGVKEEKKGKSAVKEDKKERVADKKVELKEKEDGKIESKDTDKKSDDRKIESKDTDKKSDDRKIESKDTDKKSEPKEKETDRRNEVKEKDAEKKNELKAKDTDKSAEPRDSDRKNELKETDKKSDCREKESAKENDLKDKESEKKIEQKDEKKNGIKDKKIGAIFGQKRPRESVTGLLTKGGDEGKCTRSTERDGVCRRNTENDSVNTSSVSGSNSNVNTKSRVEVDGSDSLGIEDGFEDVGYGKAIEELYFSFEGVPENECWYQTYQRFIDGIAVNEFVYDEDPLKFILPYEMPKEYIRDFISLKKGLLFKKKNDLADLVRKSPRCHASTLALISDVVLPPKKVKGAKTPKVAPAPPPPPPPPPPPVKVEEVSSDGTSTPGADSFRMHPPESFESVEELAILALHMEHIIKSELDDREEASICTPVHDVKDADDTDLRKTPPKKRGKKKRLLANCKSSKTSSAPAAAGSKLFEDPLAQEVDPAFIASLNNEIGDVAPDNILSRAAVDVVEDSSLCLCNDRASCEDFSSADENTEASSECVSLCDSETIDSSTASEPKPVRSSKKRRKNLTGWPKAQKRKKSVMPHISDDNESATGCEDSEPKRRGCRMRPDFFLGQTTAQKLAALAANDRRASPRKKASVLYMDTWPVRFRTQKNNT